MNNCVIIISLPCLRLQSTNHTTGGLVFKDILAQLKSMALMLQSYINLFEGSPIDFSGTQASVGVWPFDEILRLL